MESDNLKKWGSLVAFIVLAGISCWATEHSLHLLFGTSFPVIFVWALTIALFVVASYATKLIVDSLNMDIWLEHRRRSFWLGVVLLFFFWLLTSMPTNTHTFFFIDSIGKVIDQDVKSTSAYLQQLNSRVKTDAAYHEVVAEIEGKWDAARREYFGLGTSGQKGAGPYFRTLVEAVNDALSNYGADERHRVEVKDKYNQFNEFNFEDYGRQVQGALHYIEDNRYKVSRDAAREAARVDREIKAVYDSVSTVIGGGGVPPADLLAQQEAKIGEGYKVVKTHEHYVDFGNEADEKLYTAENITTRTKRMISVYDVWKDFLSGKYPFSFVYCIILSILVDVAAFMFFDFAFKKKE